MNIREYLEQQIKVADRHEWVLEEVLKQIDAVGAIDENKLDDLSIEDVKILEVVTSRFSKLQDHLGSKIFPVVLKLAGNDDPKQTFVDMLYKLEKIDFLASADQWRDWRDLRNDIAHEYAYTSKQLAEKINGVIDASHILLDYYKDLKKKIERIKADTI